MATLHLIIHVSSLNPLFLRFIQESCLDQLTMAREDLEPQEREVLDALADFERDYGDDKEIIQVNDVLDGTSRAEMSHDGGKLKMLFGRIWSLNNKGSVTLKHPDWQTHRDRVQKRTQAFVVQIEDIVLMYTVWMGLGTPAPLRPGNGEEGGYPIHVVDLFEAYTLDTCLDVRGWGIAAVLIKQGLFPCALFEPTIAISTQTLEFFRVVHVRCPHFTIQGFVKTLCNLHGFSICYDLYLDVRWHIEHKVLALLGCDQSWRLKNACPACTYELEGEEELIVSMLITMDGNESLRQVLRKEGSAEGVVDDEMGKPAAKSKERTDTRDAGMGTTLHRKRLMCGQRKS
ncbi:hypothetical protein B0H17DRAFT_1154820 [Mycena rosella]|uniref:Uncharacterized protein n=1 Tax=Mycena rosella TaxID=1033263 RepID=A0AAD7AY55_MYCRO|nr:hypothetical protein B0H17DRAFT_1154820 [Mycena rosella]